MRNTFYNFLNNLILVQMKPKDYFILSRIYACIYLQTNKEMLVFAYFVKFNLGIL